ncbi:mycofactocin system protein MftB [Saccharomonospora sp. CUA-673]|uniref:mycofactocin biosynthesis chaperone MftB n=1 Tax=Saccharomonospora sp. CUA-673 TaxID=1904969 RepID=UPI000967F2BE|nr:mycofactocin biosynthesis chaperone MftB [Saccharomonospora sp. CUA-673]OLT44591.1 mycofactocin system protein MftB [Saccharomonospora sp. CUA-673]
MNGPLPESNTEAFAPDRPYRLSPSVALRPEPFGALVYDFTTRKLSFLKTRLLVDVVRALDEAPDARQALAAAEVPDAEHDRYLSALAGLASAGTIEDRGES